MLEKRLQPDRRSAQSLAPAIGDLLDEVGWKPADVDLVAVSRGPGSFTGLRVGIATAKAFAYAVGAEILGVDTLETIAAGMPPDVADVSIAVDAQRGEVVAGRFRRVEDGSLRAETPPVLVEIDAWLASVPAGVFIAGPILRKRSVCVLEHVSAVAAEHWAPQAGWVARLAARDYAAGRRDDLWQIVPAYSRRSAAEEKSEKRNT